MKFNKKQNESLVLAIEQARRMANVYRTRATVVRNNFPRGMNHFIATTSTARDLDALNMGRNILVPYIYVLPNHRR